MHTLLQNNCTGSVDEVKRAVVLKKYPCVRGKRKPQGPLLWGRGKMYSLLIFYSNSFCWQSQAIFPQSANNRSRNYTKSPDRRPGVSEMV